MGDDRLHCNGLLKDGSKCDACLFEEGDGDARLPGWITRVHGLPDRKFTSLFCPVCGTLLGVTVGGEPTRERMFSEAEMQTYAESYADSVLEHHEERKGRAL